VYILDPWWNPAVEDQASDRAHRIGQDKPVMVYRLVAQDTVEERVIELQNRKRALLAAAVGDTGEVSLSKDELLFLLEG
jgi:SNF2 family DNA or RNA helicase